MFKYYTDIKLLSIKRNCEIDKCDILMLIREKTTKKTSINIH